ncbi:efflux RND transporter periplasmic adaptor subunit [Planctomicrobium sp. SH527]|uniref:efflux RND transporter periplasmic adaptor subunit n=1 Tax=Planctomicrobium sp. SH527 TaxID=3448123 RepID=UPI003F5B7AC0
MTTTSATQTESSDTFFGRLWSKSRKSAIGIMVVGLSIPVILIARTGMARLAESHAVEIPERTPLSVKSMKLVETEVTSGIQFSGVVAALRKAELSFRVGGTVQSLHQVYGAAGQLRDAHEGDQFASGEVIAQLDTADYQRERDVAAERLSVSMARLKQAHADSEEAQSAYNRALKLKADQAVSQASLEAAKARQISTLAAIDVAEREISASRIQLKQAEENLSYCTLTAPFPETTIATRSVDTHQRVPAGQVVFTVHDISSVVVNFAVQDSMLSQIRFGDVIEVTASGLSGERFEGVIHKIGTTANEQTRSYPIEVRIDAPGDLRPGMVATVNFRKNQSAILVPLTAITPIESERPGVFKITRDAGQTVIHRIPVEIRGVFDNRAAIQLPEGENPALRLGDEIVFTGVHRLRDGEVVHVIQ